MTISHVRFTPNSGHRRATDLVHLRPTPPTPAQWCRRRKTSRCVSPRAQSFLKLPVRRSDRVRLTKCVWLRLKAGPESTLHPWVRWPRQGAIFYCAIPNRACRNAARITDIEAPLIDVRFTSESGHRRTLPMPRSW